MSDNHNPTWSFYLEQKYKSFVCGMYCGAACVTLGGVVGFIIWGVLA